MPFRRPDDGPPPPRPMPGPEARLRASDAERAAPGPGPARPERAEADPPPANDDLTAEDIEREHVNALAALTPEQARAVARLNRAFRESHLGNCSAKEALTRIYAEEAAERNRARGEQAGAS